MEGNHVSAIGTCRIFNCRIRSGIQGIQAKEWGAEGLHRIKKKSKDWGYKNTQQYFWGRGHLAPALRSVGGSPLDAAPFKTVRVDFQPPEYSSLEYEAHVGMISLFNWEQNPCKGFHLPLPLLSISEYHHSSKIRIKQDPTLAYIGWTLTFESCSCQNLSIYLNAA